MPDVLAIHEGDLASADGGHGDIVAPGRRKDEITRLGALQETARLQYLQFMGVLRPKRSRIEIEELLSAAMNTANEQRKQAVAEFLEVTAAVPHDSSADGILLIAKAGAARQQAFAEYQIALNRFMDFVVSGIVPDDLK